MRSNIIKYVMLTFITIGLYFLFFFVTHLGSNKLIYYTNNYYAKTGGQAFQMFREFSHDTHFNIVVLGSSHAYRGYDTRIFEEAGFRIFNFGTSGQSISNSLIIARDYLSSDKNDLVIVDIFTGAFNFDGFESTSNLISNVPKTSSAISLGLSLKDIRGINMISHRIFNYSTIPEYLDPGYIKNGYCSTPDSVDSEIEYSVSELSLSDEAIEEFCDLINFFKSRRFNVVFVSHPIPLEYGKVNFAEFNNEINSIIEQNGYRWYNFSLTHGLDSRLHFYDHNHLNQAGVSIFNDVLIDTLIKDNILKIPAKK